MLEHVCSVLDHDNLPPKNYTQSIVCPDGCREYRMVDLASHEKGSSLRMFTLGPDGKTLSIRQNVSYSKVLYNFKNTGKN